MRCLLVLCVLTVVPGDDPWAILSSWGRWSRDSIKAFQDGKVLSGGFLDKSKKLSDAIAGHLQRAEKSRKVDDFFRESYKHGFDALVLKIESMKPLRKSTTVQDLRSLQREAENRLAALISERRLIGLVARDLDVLKVLLRDRLDAAKDVPTAKRKSFAEKCDALEAAEKAAREWSAWGDKAEESCMAAIETLKDLLAELGA